jgi:dUTP pyrophosphatase
MGDMKERLIVRIKKEREFRDLPVPSYATPLSVGVDLYAAVENQVTIPAKSWRLISTGIRIAVPEGYEAQIRPRSGLALKYGITLLNTPGTIDSDYRGIVGVILINLGEDSFTIKRGDRIAQMIICPVARLEFAEVSYLRPSERGEGGFGSTGIDLERTGEITPTDKLRRDTD